MSEPAPTFTTDQVVEASRSAQRSELVPLWSDVCDLADVICPGWQDMSDNVRRSVTGQAKRAWHAAAPKMAARVTHAQVEALGIDWHLVDVEPGSPVTGQVRTR